MRFEGIKARAIGPFREVDIDLDSIPGTLVAVTGANGAGKSTFLELLAGGMYRRTPTRGSLADLATARDAMLEVRVRNGSPYTLRHVVDCISKKGEAVVLDGSARTLTDAGKVREVDAWVARHLPAPEVLYTSTFAAQGSGGFLDLPAAERKRVLLRVLGIERLEALAEAARGKARDAQANVRTLEQRLADERARAMPVEEASQRLAEARHAMDTALAQAEASEASLRAAERIAETADQVRHERDQLSAREARAKASRADRAARRATCAAVASRAPDIARARERASEVSGDLALVRDRLAEAAREVGAAESAAADERRVLAERDGIERRIRAAESELRQAEDALRRASTVADRAREVSDAAARATALEEDVTRLRAEAQAARHDLAAAEAELAARKSEARDVERQIDAARRDLAAFEAQLEHAAAIRAAASALPEREATAAARAARIAGLDASLRSLRDQHVGAKDLRIHAMRLSLAQVADGEPDPVGTARDALSADAAMEALAERAPEEIRYAEAEIARERRAAEDDEFDLRKVRRLADQLADVERAAEAASAAHAEVERLTRALSGLAAVEQAQAAVEAARAALQARAARLDEMERELASFRRVAAVVAEVARAEVEATACRATIERLTDELSSLRSRLADAPPVGAAARALARAESSAAELRAQAARLEDELRRCETITASGVEVARAEAEVEAIDRELAQIDDDLREVAARIDALPSAESVDVDGARAAHRRARAEVDTATQAHAAAVAAHAAAEESLGRALDLEALRDGAHRELADWTRLGQDLGKDGIQALEIDAAGPELTAIANDLLHTCVSRRWTLEVRTQRSSHDGKKQIEGCDVIVVDTERGREGEAETFSGGERVMLGEALALALSVLACRRIGVEGPTLVRDESGAALDAANGRAYVAMLRRAAELIGASKTFFVSHTVELQELADARIHIESGVARVIA